MDQSTKLHPIEKVGIIFAIAATVYMVYAISEHYMNRYPLEQTVKCGGIQFIVRVDKKYTNDEVCQAISNAIRKHELTETK